MSEMSLKSMLLMFLDDKREYIHSGVIERYASGQGFKGSNGGRRMRELVREGKVSAIYERNKNTGVKEVYYRKA